MTENRFFRRSPKCKNHDTNYSWTGAKKAKQKTHFLVKETWSLRPREKLTSHEKRGDVQNGIVTIMVKHARVPISLTGKTGNSKTAT